VKIVHLVKIVAHASIESLVHVQLGSEEMIDLKDEIEVQDA
jgi:hypothetical protein